MRDGVVGRAFLERDRALIRGVIEQCAVRHGLQCGQQPLPSSFEDNTVTIDRRHVG
jgi:hypothetical protein